MFKRKRKNRRFERRHVLDVKVSSRQRRETWMRRLGMLLVMVFLLGLGTFVIGRGGDWLLEKWVYNNPAFAIHQLQIETDGALSVDQLRAWAGVKLRANLMKLDLGRIKRDLELVPVIESAAVERVLPHTLSIRVTEREPIAQVHLPPFLNRGEHRPGVYTLDAKGYFMFPLESVQRAVPASGKSPLPTLSGLPVSELRPGRRTEMPQVHAALRLIEAFQRCALAGRIELKQIDLSSPFILTVMTDRQSTIVFSLGDPDRQLRRWASVQAHSVTLGKQISWMDLSVANNVPVRWRASESIAPASS